MTVNALLDPPTPIRPVVDTLDQEILDHLDEQAVVGLDSLIALLPQYSWSQVFHAVDRLARRGTIVLRRHRFDYTLFSVNYAA